jgi:hypothetical protein
MHRSRSGLIIFVTLLLLCITALAGTYLFYFEDAGSATHSLRNSVASAQRPSTGMSAQVAGPRSDASPQITPHAAAPDAFGSLPNGLDANVKVDLSAEKPAPFAATPKSIQDADREETSEPARDDANANTHASLAQEAPAQRAPQAVREPPPAIAPPAPRPVLRPELVATLRKRAAEAMSRSDIIAARLLLESASAGGDPPALEELGQTYDPAVLERMGLGAIFAGDEQKAASLYNEAQKARASAQRN